MNQTLQEWSVYTRGRGNKISTTTSSPWRGRFGIDLWDKI